ncbi:MAG: Crp/Fnr family transcriptional regulator [Chitinophagales bacterium]
MEEYSRLFQYFSSFTELPIAYIDELKKNLSTKQIEKHTIYVDKNSYSKTIGFLSKGIMRIYDIDPSGQQWNKVILSPPSLLLGNPNFQEKSIHYLETITACEIIEFPISFLNLSLQKYPATKEIQTKILLHLFEKKSEREYDFLTLSAKERYLKFLKTHSHIIDQVPQFHIASYLGITPTQLSRINVSIRNQQM